MRALFPDHPSAITNTLEIAERCNLKLEFGAIEISRNIRRRKAKRAKRICANFATKGLHERYGDRTDSELIERLDYELGVLETTGFVSYFLIVWDFIHHAKQRGIPVGPGRGSAAGSMVAYVLGITDVDPLQFNLLFERFLNPERVSPPDIDVDFCEARRGEVLEYVRAEIWRAPRFADHHFRKTESEERGARRGPRDRPELRRGGSDREDDSERAEHHAQWDRQGRCGNGKPHTPGAIDKNLELKQAIETEPSVRQLWDYATVLEGLSRNAGVHAAGVVIGDRDLSEYVPLCRDSKGTDVISQFAMGPLTDLGMLKMDFLGLENADRDRGHGDVDPRARAGFRDQQNSARRTRRHSRCSIAARRSAFSSSNPAG